MKRLLAVILTLAMLLAVSMSVCAYDGLKPGEGTGDGGSTEIDDLVGWENPFTDVIEGKWYFNSVAAAVRIGLFTGTTDTTFEPATPLTRSMMVTLLYRMNNAPACETTFESLSEKFTDIKNGWYANALCWAYEKGYVKGTSDSTFSPDDKITRQDMMVALYRSLELAESELNADEILANVPDKGEISNYAKDAVAYGMKNDLIRGDTSGNVMPKGTASRAEAATLLMRYLLRTTD